MIAVQGAYSTAARVRVYVATTRGPVEVGRVRDQPAQLPPLPSVVTLGGSTTLADCSRDFVSFLAASVGALGRAYPNRSFRVEVEERIDSGQSFQLGLFLAVALQQAGRLAARGEPADAILWATGHVYYDFTIGTVGAVAEKIALSRPVMDEAAANGIPFLGLCPHDNAADVPSAGSAFLPVKDLKSAFALLGLDTAPITARGPPAVWRGNPYRGLEAFEAEHGAIFFGRGLAKGKLLERLKTGVRDGSAFVLVFGASGSGKSSLLRAGLWNEVEKAEENASWIRLLIGPKETAQADGSPVRALANALAASVFPIETSAATVEEKLRTQPRKEAQAVTDALGAPAAGETGARRLLIIADPLDAFALPGADPAERDAFAAALEALAAATGVRVAAAVRGDLLDKLIETSQAFKRLATNERLYHLGAPDSSELGAIIRGPAALAGVKLEDKDGRRLEDALVAEASKLQDCLPLLELALSRLYEADGPGKVLTLATYESAEGAAGMQRIIGAFAERTLDEAAAASGFERATIEKAADAIILGLADLDEGGESFGRVCHASLIRAEPVRAALVDALITNRLVVEEAATAAELPSPRPAHSAASNTIRFAHDSLLKHWPRAKDALDNQKADIELRQYLEAMAQKWSEAAAQFKNQMLLPAGRQLIEANEWRNKWSDCQLIINETITEFINKSNQYRRRKRLQTMGTVLAVLAILFVTSLISLALRGENILLSDRIRQIESLQKLAELTGELATEQIILANTISEKLERDIETMKLIRKELYKASSEFHAENGELHLAFSELVEAISLEYDPYEKITLAKSADNLLFEMQLAMNGGKNSVQNSSAALADRGFFESQLAVGKVESAANAITIARLVDRCTGNLSKFNKIEPNGLRKKGCERPTFANLSSISGDPVAVAKTYASEVFRNAEYDAACNVSYALDYMREYINEDRNLYLYLAILHGEVGVRIGEADEAIYSKYIDQRSCAFINLMRLSKTGSVNDVVEVLEIAEKS